MDPIYLMVERALKLQAVIDTFCTHSRRDADSSSHVPEGDILGPADWACFVNDGDNLAPISGTTQVIRRSQACVHFLGHAELPHCLFPPLPTTNALLPIRITAGPVTAKLRVHRRV